MPQGSWFIWMKTEGAASKKGRMKSSTLDIGLRSWTVVVLSDESSSLRALQFQASNEDSGLVEIVVLTDQWSSDLRFAANNEKRSISPSPSAPCCFSQFSAFHSEKSASSTCRSFCDTFFHETVEMDNWFTRDVLYLHFHYFPLRLIRNKTNVYVCHHFQLTTSRLRMVQQTELNKSLTVPRTWARPIVYVIRRFKRNDEYLHRWVAGTQIDESRKAKVQLWNQEFVLDHYNYHLHQVSEWYLVDLISISLRAGFHLHVP